MITRKEKMLLVVSDIPFNRLERSAVENAVAFASELGGFCVAVPEDLLKSEIRTDRVGMDGSVSEYFAAPSEFTRVWVQSKAGHEIASMLPQKQVPSPSACRLLSDNYVLSVVAESSMPKTILMERLVEGASIDGQFVSRPVRAKDERGTEIVDSKSFQAAKEFVRGSWLEYLLVAQKYHWGAEHSGIAVWGNVVWPSSVPEGVRRIVRDASSSCGFQNGEPWSFSAEEAPNWRFYLLDGDLATFSNIPPEAVVAVASAVAKKSV